MIILIALLQGCNLFDTKSSYPETGIADDGLLINFRELHKDYEGSDPELYLEMQTNKFLECANYFIDYQKTFKDTSIDIRLLGIDIGPVCLTAFGPAYVYTPFSDVEGKIELMIRDGDLRDRFEIDVTRKKVDITPIDASFTETNYTRYYRKPENSFHFYCQTQDNMTHLCQDFHDLVVNELEIMEFEFPNDGHNPYISEHVDTQRFRVSRFYTYNMVDEFHRAGDLLESFTHERIGDTQGN
ncbi:hypothetical protein QA596_04410, partial [Balneolales bacterium ANBcel1]|nr:hypothetical protein [Balneolales bacterium ANBcel1]